MAEHSNQYACPLAAVDRRLEDLHQHWHLAEAAYFDPEHFRIAIQTAIQTLRTVTFILQSNKTLIESFESWYKPWQEKLHQDTLMRWMVEARNRIEKRGDLEAHSFVRAEILASYLSEGPVLEVPAKLFQSPLQVISSIPKGAAGDHVRKNGVLRLQRRWVENSLPDYELLDAVAIAYGRIAEVVHDAHRHMGLEIPLVQDVHTGRKYDEGARSGRLPCMIGHADSRSTHIWLATGDVVNLETVKHKLDEKKVHKASKRYNLQPKNVFGDSQSIENVLGSLFQTARTMFLADGHHITIVFLFREGKPVKVVQLGIREHGEKYLLMRSLAQEVVKLGADAVILVGEEWMSPADPNHPYQRAVDSPKREEMLTARLITKVGEPMQLHAKIRRKKSKVTLEDTETLRGGAIFLFAPIFEAWGREIPKDWQELIQAAYGKPAP